MTVLQKYAVAFFISMLPLVELRAALPYAIAIGDKTIGAYLLAYAICIVGNMIPVPFIYLFARKVLEWGKDKKVIGKVFTWILAKGTRGGEKLKAKAGTTGLFIALVLFVGIPLPGTGAWTGTLAASMLDIGFKKSSIACTLGVLLAGIIMGVLSIFGVNIIG